jgi:MATE family multidrug resistance protein
MPDDAFCAYPWVMGSGAIDRLVAGAATAYPARMSDTASSRDMGYLTHTRAVLVLGLPLVGSNLAQFAVGLTDTIMLGWYDVAALASVVLGSSAFFFFLIFGSGFAWAVMPMVASFAARGDMVQVRG